MVWAICAFVGGLAFLYLGAEGLIGGSSSFALRWGIRPLVIGLTIVAVATSSPELFVSLKGALNGQYDLIMGNIIGSNIANIGLILGVSALIRPLEVHLQVFQKDLPILLAVSILVAGFGIFGFFPWWLGLVLLGSGIAYTVFLVIWAEKETFEEEASTYPQWRSWVYVIGGLGLLVLGAEGLLQGATYFARVFGVSEAIIGLTMVAVGTSLPELAASLVAARKKEGDIVLGNVLGSNLYNLFLVLGAAALIGDIQLQAFTWIPFVIMIFFTVVLLPFVRSGFVIARWEGAALLLLYFLYIYYQWE